VPETFLCAEQHLVTKSGAPIVANVSATGFDLDGRPVLLLEFQDVTEQWRLEAELRHIQKMEAVGRLAGGVAHEFNNIVTIILAQAELLEVYPHLDETLREIADTTKKAAIRAAHLTRKLLAFSRKEPIHTTRLDLNEVLHAIGGLLHFTLGERVALHVSLHDEPCRVRADRWELEQIVINLAANARDAMPRGGNFWLAVSRRDLAGAAGAPQVLLTARDDGVGMDGSVRARLFEPFFTTKAPGEGTGLGMSTVYRIIERCGGTIAVESAPGKGTTFVIALPLEPATSRSSAPAPAEERAAPGDERVLVVDDEAQVRKAVARLLRLDGYDVTTAASGEEALAMCRAAPAPFDLLLTDVVMPGMTGSELADVVRIQSPETRILFMSGYSDGAVLDHGVMQSEATLLRKPFSRKTLSARVREVLDS
jgi:signal transduction histidine kinase/CheY-like chemotaxis protein